MSISSPEQFQQEVLNSSTPVIVNFYANWCGPCKTIDYAFEDYSREFKNFKFVKVDVDELEDISYGVGIRAMPTFMLFKNGRQSDTTVGASKTAIHKFLCLAESLRLR